MIEVIPYRRLKPGFLLDDIGLVELFIRLHQVDDAFDEADQAARAAKDVQTDADDATGGIPEHEPMDAETADQNCDDTARRPARTFAYLWFLIFRHGNPFADVVCSS